MTSVYGYSTPLMNTHMENDTVCCEKKKESCCNTIWDYLNNSECYTIFKCIVLKADMCELLDNPCYNYTLFAPKDSCLCNINLNNIDKSTAIQIVKSSLLEEKIPSEILLMNNISYYSTLNPVQKLIISNNNGLLFINANSPDCIHINEVDIMVDNGIIHSTNELIIPYLV